MDSSNITITPGNGSNLAEISITQFHGLDTITFNPPLKIEIWTTEEPSIVRAYLDFGMSYDIFTDPEHNFLYNYDGSNREADPLKTTLNTIKFDLQHAFFHCEEDPNYGVLHWALYGNLAARVLLSEGPLFDTPPTL
jgi:hypothetical protein